MSLFINTSQIVNISSLPKHRLLELNDILQSDDDINRVELSQIGHELLDAALNHMHEENIRRILSMLESGKVRRTREVQNVFLEHVERALKGKQGGRRKRRTTRRSRALRRKTLKA